MYSGSEGLTVYLHRLLMGRSMHRLLFTRQMSEPQAESCGTWDPEIDGLRSVHTMSETDVTVIESVWVLYLSLSEWSTHSRTKYANKLARMCRMIINLRKEVKKKQIGECAKSQTSCSWYAGNFTRDLAHHKPSLTLKFSDFLLFPSSFILVCEWV